MMQTFAYMDGYHIKGRLLLKPICSRFLKRNLTRLNEIGAFNIDLVRDHFSKFGHQLDNLEPTSSAGQGKFEIILPPPNVTGNLHIGHALTVSIEDSLCRFHRMIGKKVCWIPGYDHAGIATQKVVEAQLLRRHAKKRSDLSDEEFLNFCEQWKNDRIRDITSQLNSLGCTLDWENLFYTLDEKFSRVVRTAFCQLHSRGLIKRERRPVETVDKGIVSDQDQWFLHCDKMNMELLDFMNNEKLHIDPYNVRGKLTEWLSYKEPWCLSRQLTWGHLIPAYFATLSQRWIIAESPEKAREQLPESERNQELRQDTDVLDTWFSSALIPLAIAGWPDKPVDKEILSLMETGHDIVGFWVARMLILCKQLTGTYPFTRVLLHGMVRDNRNRKMSKSLGNVIDPLDVIDGKTIDEMIKRMRSSNLPTEEMDQAEIDLRKQFPKGMKQCGPDAIRFVFFRHDLTQHDLKIDIIRLADEGLRHCNKLWNMAKYCERVFDSLQQDVNNIAAVKNEELIRILSSDLENENDSEVVGKLKTTVEQYVNEMERNRPHLAFRALYNFILLDICDKYLETTKQSLWKKDYARLKEISSVLRVVVGVSLYMMQTFLPYVSTFLVDSLFVRESSKDLFSKICADMNKERTQ